MILFAAAGATAEKPFRELAQHRQRAAVAAEHEADPQQHSARFRRNRRVESVLPQLADTGQGIFTGG